MERAELAARLVEAGDAEREALLKDNSALGDVELAYALKEICYDAFTSEPTKSVRAAAALELLAELNGEDETRALSEWVGGIAALVAGQMERAIAQLDLAKAHLLSLGKAPTAAATQVSKLIALSMLGRYDEAIECGLQARELFLQHGDILAAGKIENNIGNLCFRRDRYLEAEEFQSAARQRFVALKDEKQLAIIDNSLANTRALLHKFKAAEELYEEAVRLAEASGLTVTLAEIEGNIGSFALLQGRYDRALDYLERSRRRYTSLGMPHQSAIAEQEIADAYLELNLAPEAAAIYERVIPEFTRLAMRAEQARALAYHGRALVSLGRGGEALTQLRSARRLYAAEGNEVGEGMVVLTQASLAYRQRDYGAASRTAAEAESRLIDSGGWRKLLLARWLRGESERAQSHMDLARSILKQTLREAKQREQPQVAERCYTSLGLLESASGNTLSAEEAFKQAVALIERLRAPLPGEEFRAAFFSDKLVPYNELVRLCLAAGEDRIGEAFGYVERARARALADVLGGSITLQTEPGDPFEAEIWRQVEELRAELNYLYNQINQPTNKQREQPALDQELRERETRMLDLMRQLYHRGGEAAVQDPTFAMDQFQRRLAPETVLVEYADIDGKLLAFVITNEGVEVVRNLSSETDVAAELERLRFQIDSLRYGSDTIRRHLAALTERAKKHLAVLYDLLLRPVAGKLGKRGLIIVPHRSLHYVPFHALYDGEGYVIEQREVSYVPSAMVLQQCLAHENSPFQKALLMGVADERIPRVHEEIETVSRHFSDVEALLDEQATVASLRTLGPSADVLHLACHGKFRPDNPLFSSLVLGDGWLTVRDAYSLKLNCGLVTLSACETGVNAVAPGDEIMGLARGFLSAGSASLMMSLWTVDDETTSELMGDFYSRLRDSMSPARALREAQLRMIKKRPHPFFWSPFVVVGRG